MTAAGAASRRVASRVRRGTRRERAAPRDELLAVGHQQLGREHLGVLGVRRIEIHERRAQLGPLERDHSPEPPERRLGERDLSAGIAEPAARPASPATGAGPASRVRAPARARARRPSWLERRLADRPRRRGSRGRADRRRRSTAPPASVARTSPSRSSVTAWPRDCSRAARLGADAPQHRRRSTSACCPPCRSARPADSPARPARTAPAATAGADSRIARRNTRPRSSARSSPPSSVTTMSAVTPSPCTRRRAWLQARAAQPLDADHVGRHRHQERPVRGVHRAGHHLHACVEKGRVQPSPWIGAVQHRGQLHLGERLVLAAPDPTDPAERRAEIRPERLDRS